MGVTQEHAETKMVHWLLSSPNQCVFSFNAKVIAFMKATGNSLKSPVKQVSKTQTAFELGEAKTSVQ